MGRKGENIVKQFGQSWSKISPKVRQNLPIWLGMVGILLIFLSSISPQTENQQQEPTSPLHQTQELEQQLKQLISSIEGVGEVKVMLTLDTENEQIYAQDKTIESNRSPQGDTIRQQSNHVILGNGSGQQPLVETTYLPQVRGVAVVCQGAENITVVSRITDAISVVLDLPASRICVTKMK